MFPSSIIKKDSKKVKFGKEASEHALKSMSPDFKKPKEKAFPEKAIEVKPEEIKSRKPSSEDLVELEMMVSSAKKSLPKLENFNQKSAKEQFGILKQVKPPKVKSRDPQRIHRGIDELMQDSNLEFNPKEEMKKEDKLKKTLEEAPTSNPKERKKYLEALKLRMRTA